MSWREPEIKPRLIWRDGVWKCHDNFYIWGAGATPYSAWERWMINQQRRTRIPRHGLWNRRDCKGWFNRGCPSLRTYIGNKQIWGYDPSTDELILRG